ncbi:serine/threonine protein kinase [Virgibacillus flavescens]|uniref:serine/threonine protein kinase n=1 Tax=Virgibacillus flavescens TaxID=1611422 RepID=UPI003D3288F4
MRKGNEVNPIAIFHRIQHAYRFLVDRPYKKGATVADRYTILKILGMGSFGITYLCTDLRTSSECVLKQMRPSKHKKDAGPELYHNEIAILGSLAHRCIPKLYGHFAYNDHFFYTMEFIKGSNVEDVLFREDNHFSEKDALRLLKQMVDIVEYLHGKDIVHKDLRIPNMMMKDGKLFLIDFGLSRKLENSKERTTLIQDDFYDLGDILLYLLYSSYTPQSKKSRPWTEELTLQPPTKHLLERLLAIKEPYENARDLTHELNRALTALKT